MQQHSADATVMPGARFVDPKILSRIGNLELLARTVVDGFINGLHRAPYFGASIDFAEHRGYVSGDDIRRVDWRLFARTDRFFVKQYEADTNANFSLIVDVSKSMSFGSRGVTKLEYASYLGACLAYLAHRQRDQETLDSPWKAARIGHEQTTAAPSLRLELTLQKFDCSGVGFGGQMRVRNVPQVLNQ